MTAQLNGGDTGLDPGMVRVRQRLRALRSRYPGTALTTEITIIHGDQVVIRAILTLPDGTGVTAHAAEPADAAGLLDDAIEQAEWRATTRALDLLGVGDFGAETRRQPPPPPAVADPEPARSPVNDDLEDAEPEPNELTASVAALQDASPVDAPAEPEGDLDMVDFTWTHLWTWARAHGITNRSQVEERIGRSTTGLGPREIHEALIQSGLTGG